MLMSGRPENDLISMWSMGAYYNTAADLEYHHSDFEDDDSDTIYNDNDADGWRA